MTKDDLIALGLRGRLAATPSTGQTPGSVSIEILRSAVARLMSLLETDPGHACGGGPTVSVMRAAHALGATDARVLKYGDSSEVSGDKDAVVGYLAAAFGAFAPIQ